MAKQLFQPGNKAAAARPERKLMTQQLISILNEKFQGFKKVAKPVKDKDGKPMLDANKKPVMQVTWEKDGAVQDITKMRKMLDNLVFNATVLNDQNAINAIFDRVEGKPMQAIQAEDEAGNVIRATRFILEVDPAAPAPRHAPTYTPDLPDSASKH